MTAHRSSPPLEPSTVDCSVRKRVCKACDRCRLKKSKCDGASPCGRCRSDNAICVFGERKKSHDKVYPKGYVEMLEQQQAQLVTGLQEMYRRAKKGQGWIGEPLQESGNGSPLTHDILERLGALKHDSGAGVGACESQRFEEDLGLLQKRLIEGGAGLFSRSDSSDCDSDHFFSPIKSISTRDPVLFNDPWYTQLPPTPPMIDSPYSDAFGETSSTSSSSTTVTPFRPGSTFAVSSPVDTDSYNTWDTNYSYDDTFDSTCTYDIFGPAATNRSSMSSLDGGGNFEDAFNAFVNPV